MTKFSTEKLAPLNAPVFTGDARAVTPTAGYADTSVPTTAFVQAAITAAIAAASAGGFSTGDVKLTLKAVADAGWIFMNDGTIGDATSGATYANANAQALFVLLWGTVVNAWCPVSGGRGANALADFNAHKTMGLPKALGRSFACAGAGSGLTSRSLGQVSGAETETPTVAKTAYHNHGTGLGAIGVDAGATYTAYAVLSPSYTVPSNYEGGGGLLNVLDPSVYLNVMIKL